MTPFRGRAAAPRDARPHDGHEHHRNSIDENTSGGVNARQRRAVWTSRETGSASGAGASENLPAAATAHSSDSHVSAASTTWNQTISAGNSSAYCVAPTKPWQAI